MITKLYDAYICEQPLVETYSKLKSCKKDITQIVEEKFFESFTKEIVLLYDSVLYNNKTDKNFTTYLIDKWCEKNSKVNKESPYERGFHFECISFLFPMGNVTLLHNIYPSRDYGLRGYFESLDFLKDFHYQNQCDRPSNITETEWENRCKMWEEAFNKDDNNWGWASRGYSLEYHHYKDELPNIFSYGTKNLMKYIPEDSVRKKNLLTNIVWDNLANKYKNDNPDKALGIGDYLDWHSEFKKNYDNGFYENDLNKIELIKIEI